MRMYLTLINILHGCKNLLVASPLSWKQLLAYDIGLANIILVHIVLTTGPATSGRSLTSFVQDMFLEVSS